MKWRNLPKKWGPAHGNLPDLSDPGQALGRMFADLEKWLDATHWQSLFEQMNNRIRVDETKDAFQITVLLDGIERPGDIEARLAQGRLHLRRTVRLETKTDGDHGAVWKSYYEHFERTVPLPAPVRWADRQIAAQPGRWSIRLPKA